MGEFGHAPMGRAMLSKSLIQFPVDGWGLCSLPVVWPNYGRGNGCMVRVMVVKANSSKKTYASMPCHNWEWSMSRLCIVTLLV